MGNEKVYIVTEGTYSDYHIEAVFKTKEEAEEYIDANCSSYAEIEEYDLSAPVTRKRREYSVSISLDDTGEDSCVSWDVSSYGGTRIDTFYVFEGSDGSRSIVFYLWSDSAKRAVKVARERLAQIKAQPWLYPCWDNKCVGSIIMERTCNFHYPRYNFINMDMELSCGERFIPKVAATNMGLTEAEFATKYTIIFNESK